VRTAKLTGGEKDDGIVARFYRGESGSGLGSGGGVTSNEEAGGGALGTDEERDGRKGGNGMTVDGF
jgi:hypothetical protein